MRRPRPEWLIPRPAAARYTRVTNARRSRLYVPVRPVAATQKEPAMLFLCRSFRCRPALALALVAGVALPSSAEVESRGAVSEVTVYRGQALVTRSVEVKPGPEGPGL